MAREARLSNLMRPPEANFAARLVKLKGLAPPIDIVSLANEYASVQLVTFPVQIDGVCLDLKQQGKRPRILISRNLPLRRFRFTLAHELGHVIIPWHVGSIVDETEESHFDLGFTYWQLEGEANRFASELLMPSDWVAEIIERKDPIAAADHISATADVSFAATMIKIQNSLPPGYVFARFTDDELMYSGRSAGTLASMPQTTKSRVSRLFPQAASHWIKSYGQEEYHIWHFHHEVPLSSSSRPWREIFEEICDDIAVPAPERAKFKQRVTAILSSANSRTRISRSPETVNAACIQRLQANVGDVPRLEDFIRHPKLGELLAAKIGEFFNKVN
jgi:Zn-dependent peptidase ImmA (M78 family)